MRRAGIFLLAVIAVVAMTGPVSAQPKVTITGFVDNITSWSKNMSVVDNNYARTGDVEWYARTRVRPDITAEVGTTKFVLGIELDETWGQTGVTDNTAPNRFGTTSSWDLNTDTQGVLEIKWAYTEFDLPIVPVPTRIRLGAQPWDATYKTSALAQSDFAGIHMENRWNPMIRTRFTYATIEEQSSGVRDGFIRGDDFAIVTSIEVTPFKGLDIQPTFSYANFQGITSGSARSNKGGVCTVAACFPTGNSTINPTTAAPFGSSAIEDRFTVGVDARWRLGPFYLDPTVFYQFGSRDQVVPILPGMVNGTFNTLQLDAWFVDIRGGWQAGPLLLELAAAYTTGNRASDRIDQNASRIKYYQPLSTDSGYFITWGEIWALGIDYFNATHQTTSGMATHQTIGYDKYGLIRFAPRASYALTPAFKLRVGFMSSWTAQGVDTQTSTITTTAGLAPCTATGFAAAQLAPGGVANCTPTGNASYLGSELDLGFTWNFAPNVVLDAVYAHGWMGNAMASTVAINSATGVAASARNPHDVDTVAMRVRYSW